MSKKEVEKIMVTEIKRILKDSPGEFENFTLESHFFSDLGFDSLEVIDLDMAVEKQIKSKFNENCSSCFDKVFSEYPNPTVGNAIDCIWENIRHNV